MRRLIVGLAVGGLLCVVGCPHTLYEVQMTPRGERVERTVSSQRVGEEAPATQPDGRPPPPPEVTTVKGVYAGLMPDDVGGARGRYEHIATSLGGVTAYLERLRGDDDQAAIVEAQFRAVDRVVDILVGWAAAERGDRKEFPKLRAFLDTELRRDLKNFALGTWAFSAANRQVAESGQTGLKSVQFETVARGVQYLLEHGYLRPEDLTLIAKVQEASGEQEQLALVRPIVRRVLAEKIGLTDKAFIDDLIALLDKPEEVEKSLAEYVTGTETFKKELAEWKRRAATQPEDQKESEPEPLVWVWLQEQVAAMFHVDLDLFDSDDEVKIALKTGIEPLKTNGRWDAQAGQVTWACRVAPKENDQTQLPVICYAVWAHPDEKFQKARFGQVAIAGADLAAYCLWHKGLTGAQARQWDAFLAKLKPGEKLVGELEGFRFTATAPSPETQLEDKAVPGAEMILEKLKEESEPGGSKESQG